MRKEILLNDNWVFHRGDFDTPINPDKGPTYQQSKTERKLFGPASYNYIDIPNNFGNHGDIGADRWEWVTVPHDYVVCQDADKKENQAIGYLHYDNAWYRKHFTLDKEDSEKRVLLRFDGVAGHTTVYLNGCLMYHNFSRYNTFERDITDHAHFDKENVLAVYINPEEFEGWWYQGAGIYRDVHLTITEPVAIDLWGVYAPYEKTDENDWKINFETTVINADYEDADVEAESFVYDKDGNLVASASGAGSVALREKGVLKYSCVVKNPLLWDCDNPNLYSIKTILKQNGEEIDENYTRIGFRTVEITVENGLLLNGKKTYINGVCGHQDFSFTGLAMPDNIARYRTKLLKEMGANGYRTAHYQQHEAILDSMDEQGMLVMNAARWFESTKESFEQIESLIKRDRNRPSVIFWSTSNEERLHITPNGRKIHRAIAAHIRKFDYTRPITAAEDKNPDESTIYDYCDIIGINYNLPLYDQVHEMVPDKPIFASECAATISTRGWNLPEFSKGQRFAEDDIEFLEWFVARENTWKFLKARPYVFGAYQWSSNEYRGESVWPRLFSESGSIDFCYKKKANFYLNKAHWTVEPMAHIATHWNYEGMEGREFDIRVYTNCEELELFLNGETQGRKQIELYGHGEWKVPFQKGELKVIGYKNGVPVCEDRVETTGKPVALKLSLDNDFEANGRDIALFTCVCLDSEGREVPDAREYISFTTSKNAELIGTGSDACDGKNITNSERQMFMGKITAAVRVAKGSEKVEIFAFGRTCGNTYLSIDLK